MSSDLFRVREHVIPSQYIREWPRATAGDQEEPLKLHVKQYTPIDSAQHQPGAITIIGAHANGFPKELYEPLWDELYKRSKASGFNIRGIWIADVAQQGASSVLNENRLGNDPSWMDHSRDLLYMINIFQAEIRRPLIGVGHSMGGCQLVNLSIMHPRLLTTLILIDPVIQIFPQDPNSMRTTDVAHASTYRRDLWKSRSAAAEAFARSPFYQAWDKRVFDRWVQYGLRDLPTAVYPDVLAESKEEIPVTLTTSKHQEVWTFARPNFEGIDAKGEAVLNRRTHPDLDPALGTSVHPFYRSESHDTFPKLQYLRPSVLYIFGGLSELSIPEWRNQKMKVTGVGVGGSGGTKEGRVREVVFEKIGHLVPMEAVDETADVTVEWLGQELNRWRVEEEALNKATREQPKEDSIRVNSDWYKNMGPPLNREKQTSPTKL